ncbi:MAG TPA: hypothetical protein VF170_13210 [Planctomycetaceae bacterium]
MDAEYESDDTLTAAATVGPEDLRRGDYVAVLNRTYEAPSFLWCCGTANLAPEEPVRIRWRTREGGRPLRVEAVCLPFVFLKTPKGRYRSIDLRQVELVRLDGRYGRFVWKKLRQQARPPAGTSPRR